MAGDGAAIDIGITKAITAPFKIASFVIIGFFVILVGRMAIDLWILADGSQDALEAPTAVIGRELARARLAPDFLGSTTHDRAVTWSVFITEWFYRKPGLVHETDTTVGTTEQAVRRGVRSMNFAIGRALTGSQVIAIRAAVVVSYLPWMGFLYVLAFVDGIMERARRKYGGGRESSTLYHRAKYFQVSLATIVVAGFLWWPGDLDSSLIITLATLGCASLARLQAEYYKKYV
jgi:hypothetical protein